MDRLSVRALQLRRGEKQWLIQLNDARLRPHAGSMGEQLAQAYLENARRARLLLVMEYVRTRTTRQLAKSAPPTSD